jgi:cell wall-associated NlpC family hydrolase
MRSLGQIADARRSAGAWRAVGAESAVGGRHGRRLGAAALAVSVVAGLLGIAGTAESVSAASRPALTRWAGTDRYGTAAQASAATFLPGVAVVYLATGADYHDALVASAVAGGHGPVLLTTVDALPGATAAELGRLRPKRLVVVGAATAVSDATMAAAGAAAGAPATRIAGADHAGTADVLSQSTFPAGAPVAYIATDGGYADALSGAAADAGRGPVLLLSSGALSTQTAAELRRLAPKQVVILGGTAAVSDATSSAVHSAATAAGLTRLAGADRFATAAAVSAATFAPGGPVFVATGENYPDALAAAAASGGRGPVLLVDQQALPNSTAAELRRLNGQRTFVLGGGMAVGDSVAQLADRLTAQGIPAPLASAATAVASARAQLGKPYVWAGAGPSNFDCSGLTAFVWRAAGVSLPHNAAAQADLVASIPVSDILPGDLLFYDSPVVGHVAIYIGNGQMIEAAHTGTPVRISAPMRPELVGAGRPT